MSFAWKSGMVSSEDIHQLESELEHEKAALREDVSHIKQKVQKTRAQLSPTNLVRENILLFSGIALALGFILGYRGVPLEKIAKPAARSILSTAGKQAAGRAIRE
jgi:hypothetical protein